ncbi:MAG: hypothetical protein A2Z83_07910 [Omnitrophica bacterium GWA2_52_8]|nr:MAG: hypothetical protein A2Z83_07910 [Omnitrophica bacterium GWA2_52_8]
MKNKSSICYWILSAVLAGGCAALPMTARTEKARGFAFQKGLTAETVTAGDFTLNVFMRAAEPGKEAVFYIEGDGLAWLSRGRISPDPTPVDFVALKLAVRDPSPNVIYLGRPCQYDSLENDALCSSKEYWTGKRFAPEVVRALDEAVSIYKERFRFRAVHLTGFSGGGALAVLVAAGRDDVASIKTVVGNLDHEAVNRLHGVSPLAGSLNAIDVAPQVRDIPQIHYTGLKDKVVPPVIAEGFKDAAGDDRCILIVNMENAGHTEGWEDKWQALLSWVPRCKT